MWSPARPTQAGLGHHSQSPQAEHQATGGNHTSSLTLMATGVRYTSPVYREGAGSQELGWLPPISQLQGGGGAGIKVGLENLKPTLSLPSHLLLTRSERGRSQASYKGVSLRDSSGGWSPLVTSTPQGLVGDKLVACCTPPQHHSFEPWRRLLD